MAKAVIHAGGAGAGQAAKICNNMILGATMIATCESFVLAQKLGLDPKVFFDIASKASGQSWSMTSYAPVPGVGPETPADHDYEGGFAAALMLKDLKLAMEAAQQAGAYTPMGGEAEELYQRFVDRGGGSKDFSGIIKMIDDSWNPNKHRSEHAHCLLAATAAAAFLGGCGGPETSQANNTQANISNSASPPATANASTTTTNSMLMLAAAPSKDQALKIMHDRHEAMEGLGKAMKALHRGLDATPPDVNSVRTQTAIMASTAAKIPGMFPAGTGPDVGKTRAKPEIWKQQALFLKKSKDYRRRVPGAGRRSQSRRHEQDHGAARRRR